MEQLVEMQGVSQLEELEVEPDKSREELEAKRDESQLEELEAGRDESRLEVLVEEQQDEFQPVVQACCMSQAEALASPT